MKSTIAQFRLFGESVNTHLKEKVLSLLRIDESIALCLRRLIYCSGCILLDRHI